jgi:hypothetical protein
MSESVNSGPQSPNQLPLYPESGLKVRHRVRSKCVNSGSRLFAEDNSVSRKHQSCATYGMALLNHSLLGQRRRMSADHIEIRRLAQEDAADAVL